MPEVISRFRGDHFFLSNMWPLEVPILTPFGEAKTSEHAYQAMKFADRDISELIIKCPNGVMAKNVAHNVEDIGVPLISDWHELKVGIMLGIVREKFLRNPELREKLLRTGDAVLVEGNTWNDNFWGVCPPNHGIGSNMLGKVLMAVRGEL